MALTPFAFYEGASEGLHMGKQKQPAKSIIRKKIFIAEVKTPRSWDFATARAESH
jgi:hypothetical protein